MIATAYRYLKRYPALSVFAMVSMICASFFEGVSFTMLIPLIQGMISKDAAGLRSITFLERFMPAGMAASQAAMVMAIFAGLFVILCMKNVFLYISTMMITRLRLGVTRDLSSSLMDHLISYDLAYFDSAKTGQLLTNIDAETNRIGTFVLNTLNFVSLVIRVVTYVTVLFIISWQASIAIFAMMAVVLLPLEIIMKRLHLLGGQLSRALGDFNFKMLEILGGIRLIKERGTEERERGRFAAAAEDLFRCHYQVNRYTNLLVPLSETVIFGIITAALLVILGMVRVDMARLFPFIAAYLAILAKMLSQLNQMNTVRSTAIANMAALANYEQMCDARQKRTIENGKIELKGFSRGIVFKDVFFSYEIAKPVLGGISLVIPKGKVTAIVGASGSGKSTLVSLIMRFYDPNKGKVIVDGIDLKELDVRSWRRRIGFVSQNLFLFNASVRYNITYGAGSASDERVSKAASIAHADTFINELPEKYDTIIGERGIQLSGGQRQRLSIARAIIENPELLILDEATSSLDSETEVLIQDALSSIMANRTVIAIAHRLSTVTQADKIVVIKDGAIVAEGTHSGLLQESSHYRALHESQFGM